MKTATLLFLGFAARLAFAGATVAGARPAIEAGVSYFDFRDAKFEPAPRPLVLDEDGKFAPFIAVTQPFSERFALRLSYQYLDDLRAIAQFGSPPGSPSSPLTVIVWGHYRDDVHIVGAAPEFRWALSPQVNLALAPQVNWVASRGTIAYSSDNALVLLRAPHGRRDDGFTLGAALRVQCALGARSGISFGYQYLDLEPSFERKAHVFSAGCSWQF